MLSVDRRVSWTTDPSYAAAWIGQRRQEACLSAVGVEGKPWTTKLACGSCQVDQECSW